MTTPRKLNQSDLGKKFTASVWDKHQHMTLFGITSRGDAVGEIESGQGSAWGDHYDWLPYTEPQPPKKTVLMAPALVEEYSDKPLQVTREVFKNEEEARNYIESRYEALIDFPAKDASGNEIWYQVPIEENNQ